MFLVTGWCGSAMSADRRDTLPNGAMRSSQEEVRTRKSFSVEWTEASWRRHAQSNTHRGTPTAAQTDQWASDRQRHSRWGSHLMRFFCCRRSSPSPAHVNILLRYSKPMEGRRSAMPDPSFMHHPNNAQVMLGCLGLCYVCFMVLFDNWAISATV